MAEQSEQDGVRVDKWLWAARFFKTRALAVEAINGGHVHLNDTRVKPSRVLRVGDCLAIRKAGLEFVVVVEQCSDRRGSATVARELYRETEESREKRERLQEEKRLLATAAPAAGRPNKRDRRHIIRFTGKGG